MIERLINLECTYGGSEYSKLTEQIFRLKNLLCGQLDQEGTQWLEQLTDAYMRQENAALRDAFAEGFWAAVELMLEFGNWKQNSRV